MRIPKKEFTATAVGHTLREVACESCGAEYVYVLKREGMGTASSVLFLDNRGAEARAAKAARESLAAMLASGVDGVPCPGCGWYQAEMVTHMRKEWGGALGFAGIMVAILGGIGLLLCAIIGYAAWMDAGPRGKGPTVPQIEVAAVISGLVVAVGLALCFLRARWAAGVDPNSEPETDRLALGRERAALVGECTPERMEELLSAAGAGR